MVTNRTCCPIWVMQLLLAHITVSLFVHINMRAEGGSLKATCMGIILSFKYHTYRTYNHEILHSYIHMYMYKYIHRSKFKFKIVGISTN